MICPFCAHRQDRVIDSRESKEGDVIRRRRECLKCERRFTTYERSDEVPYVVVKRDGRREKFDRQKVLEGLIKACEKRPVGMAVLAHKPDAPARDRSRTLAGASGLCGVSQARFILMRNSALLLVRAMRPVSSSIASTGFMSLSTFRRM